MKLYTQITELPFYLFVEISVTGELKHLVIEDDEEESTDKDLEEAWNEIQSQYAEAIGDSEQKLVLKLIKEIAAIESKYNKVVLLASVLKTRYVEQFAKMLNSVLVTSFKFDITNLTQYDKELDRCLTRAKSFKIDYERKTLELESLLQKRGGSNEKPTREYYYKLLNAISRFVGFKLSAKEITVFEFCDFLHQMTKEAERQTTKK